MSAVVKWAAPFVRRPFLSTLLLLLLLVLLRFFSAYLRHWPSKALQRWRYRKRRTHRTSRKDKAVKEIQESLPNIVILLGITGSGKTTWANQYKSRCDRSYTIISTDDAQRMVGDSVDDMSRDKEICDKTVEMVTRLLSEKKNVILDDGTHALQKDFRRRILSISTPCNHLVKEFPMKSIYVLARLEKKAEQDGTQLAPTQVELEAMEALFDASRAEVKEEGWIPLLDSVYSNSRAKHSSKRRSHRS